MKYIIFLTICTPLFIAAKDLFNFDEKNVNYIISGTRYPPPPPVEDAAEMARYIVHYSDWTALAHVSHQKNISGLPMARVYSMSDGPLSNSSGIPYLYTSFFDGVPRDLRIDNKCSLTMSLAEGDYCARKQLDPEDPRCAQVILIGNYIFLQNNTQEWKFAETALFSRHPAMKTWPKCHHFTFGKLDIKSIILVDYFGGSKYPNVEDYFKAKPLRKISKSIFVEMI
uniref:Putative pyridoxamine 5'-phosphate oxidase n=1 Tax=Panstrongylus lignarius TaxID=156445 RepID=A0A224XVV5_9HEMI